MRRFLRICGLIVLCLCGVAAAILLSNQIDQPLLPEAQALLQGPGQAPPREQNALYALIGIGKKDPDFERTGWDIAQEFTAQVKAGRDIGAPLPGDALPKLKFVGDRNALPPLGDLDAADKQLAADPAQSDRWLADNQELLRRYERLKQYAHYANALPADIMTDIVPSWETVSLAKRLWTLDLARSITGGHVDEAIGGLDEDTAYWRRLLGEPHQGLISKMVMVAQVRCDFRLAAALIRSHKLEARQLAALRGIVAPLTAEERSLAGPFQDQLRIDAEIVAGYPYPLPTASQESQPQSMVDRIHGWVDQRLLAPHATVNLLFRQNQIDIEIDRAPCTQFAANKSRQLGFPPLGWWTFWYNPTGKTLLAVANAFNHDYSGRMCDLQGIQRLLALQLLLRENNVGDDRIAGFIQQAGPDYADPFTGTPMQWQAQQHGLSFSAVHPLNRDLLPWPI